MISESFVPPRHGESIPLLCLECKKMFVGPNPRGSSLFGDLVNNHRKAKCPECGSKKVVPHPGVHW